MSKTIVQPLFLGGLSWILQMPGLFRVYYYVDKFSLEKDGRDIYSEHKLFNAAAEFCQKWKLLPFVPEYEKRNCVFLSPQLYNNTAK